MPRKISEANGEGMTNGARVGARQSESETRGAPQLGRGPPKIGALVDRTHGTASSKVASCASLPALSVGASRIDCERGTRRYAHTAKQRLAVDFRVAAVQPAIKATAYLKKKNLPLAKGLELRDRGPCLRRASKHKCAKRDGTHIKLANSAHEVTARRPDLDMDKTRKRWMSDDPVCRTGGLHCRLLYAAASISVKPGGAIIPSGYRAHGSTGTFILTSAAVARHGLWYCAPILAYDSCTGPRWW